MGVFEPTTRSSPALVASQENCLETTEPLWRISMLMKMHWSTWDELLEQAAQDRQLARFVFDRQMAEYIQDRAALAAEAELKLVADKGSREPVLTG